MSETASEISIPKRLARAAVCCIVGAGLIVGIGLIVDRLPLANPTVCPLVQLVRPDAPSMSPKWQEWSLRLTAGAMVLVLAMLEAAVARLLRPRQSWTKLTLVFALFIALLSPGALWQLWNPWAAILLSFGAAVLLQGVALLLLRVTNDMEERRTVMMPLATNAVSYGLGAAVLAAVIYLPPMFNSDPTVLRDLRGTMLLHRFGSANMRTGGVQCQIDEWPPEGMAIAAGASHGTISYIRHGWLCQYRVGHKEGPTQVHLPPGVNRVYALSPDGTIIVGRRNDRAIVYDTSRHKVLSVVPREFPPLSRDQVLSMEWFQPHGETTPHLARLSRGGRYLAKLLDGKLWLLNCRTGQSRKLARCMNAYYAPGFNFSPTSDELAWAGWDAHMKYAIFIYDCATGAKRSIALKECPMNDSVVWSPDGRYLAYECINPSALADRLWLNCIRVISADGKRSAITAPGCGGVAFTWLP